jgi:hypothetical protein
MIKKSLNALPLFLASIRTIRSFQHTAKTQNRKFETYIPIKVIARPQSQFPHSCVCEKFIYSHDWSAYSAAGKYVDRSWKYINSSQTDT